MRIRQDGKLTTAQGRWHGPVVGADGLKPYLEFYRKSLASLGWTERSAGVTAEVIDAHYFNTQRKLELEVYLDTTGGPGTTSLNANVSLNIHEPTS